MEVKPISGRVQCRHFDGFTHQEADFLTATEHWVLALNFRQQFPGRTLFILKRCARGMRELLTDELLDLDDAYRQWEFAVEKSLGLTAQRGALWFNFAHLANEQRLHGGHMHWHGVPRLYVPATIAGMHYDAESLKDREKNYSRIEDKGVVTPQLARKRIRNELRRHLIP